MDIRHGKRSSQSNDDQLANKKRRIVGSAEVECVEIPGRIASIELENFMCHGRLKVDFDVANNNCFYIGGRNGSGKSALFAALNICLGGRGATNDRGSSVRDYIKEGQSSAKIRVTLTNRGLGKSPEYGDEIIVERTIGQKDSRYRLKSVQRTGNRTREELVTTRKADLDRLLAKLGIQTENPVCWMSQDRSRQFLQDMKPEKLYDIFVTATEISFTRASYTRAGHYVYADMTYVVQNMKQNLSKMKDEVLALKAKHEQAQSIERQAVELDEIRFLVFWIKVRDALKEVKKWKGAIKFALEGIQKLPKEEDIEAKRDALNRDHEEALEKEAEAKTHVERARQEVLRKEKVWQEHMDDLDREKNNLRKKEREEREIDEQIKSLEHQIKEMQRKIQASQEGQVNLLALEAKAAEMGEKVTGLGRKQKDLNDLRKRYDDKLKEAEVAERQLGNDLRNAEETLRRLRGDKQREEAAKVNEMARFGVNVPRINELINRNAKLFSRRPLGPIGAFVKVNDEKWALAVELAIGSMMQGYLCSSIRDKKALQDLMIRDGIKNKPPFFISKFSDQRYNTRKYEPPMQWLTVLRLIEVEEVNVFNALVNNVKIESILLIAEDSEAREIMSERPPQAANKAYTLNGAEVYPQRENEFYRFYTNSKKNTPQYLVKGSDTAASISEDDIKRAESAVSEVRSRLEGAKRERETVTLSIAKLSQKVSRLADEVRKAIRDKDDADRELSLAQIDDKADDQLENLVNSSKEFMKLKAAAHEQFEAAQASLVEHGKKFQAAEAEKKAAKKILLQNLEDLKIVQQKIGKFSEDLDELDKEEQEAKDKRITVEAKVKKFEENLAVARKNYDERKKEAESSNLPRPKGFTDPPDLESLPNLKETEDAYKQKEAYLKTARESVKSAKDSAAAFSVAHAKYKKEVEAYKDSKLLLQKLKDKMERRHECYNMLCQGISSRLRGSYRDLMLARDFLGDLDISHERRTITISAVVNAGLTSNGSNIEERSYRLELRKEEASDAVQDLKGLSGGERTYTSACFIMALWETMEAPFRCMDEFDVFLDLKNRKLVMELLSHLATSRFPSNQFIFFTPQGISELLKRRRVQLFEMPKVRND